MYINCDLILLKINMKGFYQYLFPLKMFAYLDQFKNKFS